MGTLQVRTRVYKTPSRAAIRTPEAWDKWAINAALHLTSTVLADSDAEDLYIPYDYLEVGTLVALATGGAYSGLWVPYLPNIAAANGEDTARGIIAQPVTIDREPRGSVEGAVVQVPIYPEGTPVQVFTSKMPAYNDHTAYAGGAGSSAAVAAADLPTGAVDLDALGVTNIAGI